METSIGFASSLIPLILNGTKTLTYRLGNKYKDTKVGDQLDFRDSSTNKIIGKLEIIERTNILFKDLPINRVGHEVYSSKEKQKETFKKYYGNVNDDENVIILGYKVIYLY